MTASGPKEEYWRKCAKEVFADDPDEAYRLDSQRNPVRYGQSVDKHMGSLKKKYQEINKSLGKTGAGKLYHDMVEGSRMRSLVEDLMEQYKLPHWPQLHGFWMKIPSYNPIALNSSPHQNLSADAEQLFGANSKGKKRARAAHNQDDPPPPEGEELDGDAEADSNGNGDGDGEDGDDGERSAKDDDDLMQVDDQGDLLALEGVKRAIAAHYRLESEDLYGDAVAKGDVIDLNSPPTTPPAKVRHTSRDQSKPSSSNPSTAPSRSSSMGSGNLSGDALALSGLLHGRSNNRGRGRGMTPPNRGRSPSLSVSQRPSRQSSVARSSVGKGRTVTAAMVSDQLGSMASSIQESSSAMQAQAAEAAKLRMEATVHTTEMKRAEFEMRTAEAQERMMRMNAEDRHSKRVLNEKLADQAHQEKMALVEIEKMRLQQQQNQSNRDRDRSPPFEDRGWSKEDGRQPRDRGRQHHDHPSSPIGDTRDLYARSHAPPSSPPRPPRDRARQYDDRASSPVGDERDSHRRSRLPRDHAHHYDDRASSPIGDARDSYARSHAPLSSPPRPPRDHARHYDDRASSPIGDARDSYGHSHAPPSSPPRPPRCHDRERFLC